MKLVRNDEQIVHIASDMNGEFILTQECYVEGSAKLGFFGTINENDPEEIAIASTDYIDIYFNPHAYDSTGGIPITQPTPTQWDIIIGQMSDIKDDILDAKQQVDEKAEEIRQYVANVEYVNINNKPQTWSDLVGVSEGK